MKLKKHIKSILSPFLNRLGFVQKDEILIMQQSVEPLKNVLIEEFFETLISLNYSPKHIIDVGANKGSWTREVMKYFPNAYYTLFEPQESLHEHMQDLLKSEKVEAYARGVGSSTGELKFTIADRDDSCSFIYSENEAEKLGFKQVVAPIVTLNDFFKDSDKPIPDLIKIDAEGLDLEVLKGATNFLGKTEVVLIEACVVSKLYDNDIKTVINTMSDYGYKLFDITDLNKPFDDTKVLWLTELAFVLDLGYINSKSFSL